MQNLYGQTRMQGHKPCLSVLPDGAFRSRCRLMGLACGRRSGLVWGRGHPSPPAHSSGLRGIDQRQCCMKESQARMWKISRMETIMRKGKGEKRAGGQGTQKRC